VLVHRTPLVQHRRHVLEPERPMAATHLRVHIFPHGGVNRLRVFGYATDTVAEASALARLNGLGDDAARETFMSMCGAAEWAHTMASVRPFKSVRSLMKAAERAWWTLDERAWREAFLAHPRIGDRTKAAAATAQSATWSAGEQAGVERADRGVAERLEQLNARYEEIHGFIYIVCATGKSAAELLAILEERLEQPTPIELDRAAREQMQITRLRLEKWLHAHLQA
jgi:allantoicase